MSREYVLIFSTRYEFNDEYHNPEMLVIEKDRPAWQKGRLNLPGGKIEPGETPVDAAFREMMEETGLKTGEIVQMGVMRDRDLTIYCMRGWVRPEKQIKPREGETERVYWEEIDAVMKDPRLIPNLRAIVPLMRCGITDWVLTDDATSVGQKGGHTFSLTVPTY